MYESSILAELLCTRLCHDITGPIGAVNNGAEFLEEENFSMNEDALKLITESAREAVTRLQFFRQAYGRVKDFGDACLEDRKQLVLGYLRQTRVTLDWPDTHTDAAEIGMSQGTAKLLLNLVVIATGALIRGGTLSVRLMREGDTMRLSLVGEGDAVKLDDALVLALTRGVPDETLTPKTVQAQLTRLLAEYLNARLELTYTATRIEITVTKAI